MISLDFVLKKDDSCYLQVFLKERKYIEEKVVSHIHDNSNDFFDLVILIKNSFSFNECVKKTLL